jgi:hypothetical protein
VLAQTKRRRISLLSLPVVVAIGFLLVARLAAWQQSDLIADLSDRVARGETSEAKEALRALAAIPSPPIAVLVDAAATDERETAEAAQVAIDRLLRRVQRDVEKKRRIGAAASQLTELSQSLAEKRSNFSHADFRWLEATARKILRIANTFPPQKTPLVAVHCDAILSAVTAGQPVNEKPADQVPASDTAEEDQASNNSNLERELSAYEPQPREDSAATTGPTQNEIGPAVESPAPLMQQAPESILESAPSADTDHRSDWSQPLLRFVPSGQTNPPISVAESPQSPFSRDATTVRPAPARLSESGTQENLAAADSRQLLVSWLETKDGNVRPITQELAARGFGKLTIPLVQQFFSSDPHERIRLIDCVLARPDTGAGAWLQLLAEDSDAEVRLFAVTFMATSNDATLVEKAWQIAIRDRDPRIADLAERLRERRTRTLRR